MSALWLVLIAGRVVSCPLRGCRPESTRVSI
jgi:hypothetical protein